MQRPLGPPWTSLLLAAALAMPIPAAAAEPARPSLTSGELHWTASVPWDSAVLRIAAPDGSISESRFRQGDALVFTPRDPAGLPLEDGRYRYELRFAPADYLRIASRSPGAAASEAVQRHQWSLSGVFRIESGRLVADSAAAEPESERLNRDQVIADDLIVQGKACIGASCVMDEVFGSGTLRIKYSNIGSIDFVDTSTGDPNTNWRIVGNDASAEFFVIKDAERNNDVLMFEGGAPDNALHVTSKGYLGMRTALPARPIHIVAGNSPGLRLEQDGSDGFSPYTWEVAGNESNFVITDITNEQVIVLIKPGAPKHGLVINADGTVVLAGDLTVSSSRESKRDLESVATDELLDALVDLNLYRWSYKRDQRGVRHLGPVAEEFHQAFGLGWDAQHLSPGDSAGVALGSIQALARRVNDQAVLLEALLAAGEQRQEEIRALRARLDALGR